MTSCRDRFDYGGVQVVLMLVGNFLLAHEKICATENSPTKTSEISSAN